MRTIRGVDCLIVNDAELRQLTDEPNLVRAARARARRWARAWWSPSRASTARRCSRARASSALPAYPTRDVVDPTGAGDTFAGGFMGYVAAHADEELTDELLRRAMAYGTALASFNVEAFGTERMQTLTGEEIAERVADARSASPASTRRRSPFAGLSGLRYRRVGGLPSRCTMGVVRCSVTCSSC